MGLFLQTAVIPGGTKQEAQRAVKALEESKHNIEGIIADECQYKEYDKGVGIYFNDDCIGYESLAKALSTLTDKPVMVLYIYDGDFWGYYLYENGIAIDEFDPVPEYFEGSATDKERQKVKGNAQLVAKYFDVEAADIERYLVFWSDDREDEESAYEDDEFLIGEDWQIADFMRKLGFPWEDSLQDTDE